MLHTPLAPPLSNACRSQKGSVLIIVLVIMTMGISLSIYVSGAAKDLVTSSFLLEDKLKAKLEAESQVETLRYLLAINPFSSSWVDLPNRPLDFSLPERLSLTGESHEMQNSMVSIRDTASMFSVPWAQPEVLKRYLVASGSTVELAAQAADGLSDWRDVDHFKRLNGAEDFDYRQRRPLAWSPRNNWSIQAKEEIGLVADLNQSEQWPHLSSMLVWTPRAGSNLGSSSARMLQSQLNISAEQAAQLVERRKLRGWLSEMDLLQITGSKGGLDDGTNSSFPSRIVVVKVSTTIGEARENLSVVMDFLPYDQAPVTTLRYEP